MHVFSATTQFLYSPSKQNSSTILYIHSSSASFHIHSFTYFSMTCETLYSIETSPVNVINSLPLDNSRGHFPALTLRHLSCTTLDHWILPRIPTPFVSMMSHSSCFFLFLFFILSQSVYVISFSEGSFRICCWPLFSSLLYPLLWWSYKFTWL